MNHKHLFTRFLFAAALCLAACGSPGDEFSELADDDSPASFVIDGTTATMNGLIDSSTPNEVGALIEAGVTEIILVDVPGSNDDESNLMASRLVRDAGITTHVPADGFIASGGVDFFLAGAARSWESGAEFGVHSWTDGENEGGDLDRDDPQHDLVLDYYDEVGVDEAFYWFTLDAAPAADLHIMTDDELEQFSFASG